MVKVKKIGKITMAKKYLVTGGTGFIGAAIIKNLIRDGHHVICYDNNSRGSNRRLSDVLKDVELIDGDVRDSEALNAAAKGADSILHLAFVNGTEFFYSKPELVLDVGVRGMVNVLDACKTMNVPELILASSSEVYQSPPSIPTDEFAPLSIPDVMNPRYSYAGGKLISELMAINYGRNNFERVVVFRPHNVYGPDMGWEHVLPQFVSRIMKNIKNNLSEPMKFKIQGDGTQTRAFIHIDDFVEGIRHILLKGKHLNIYHVGNPEETSIRDAALEIAKFLKVDIEVISGPNQLGGTLRRCPDIKKLNALGFKPRINFHNGVPDLITWYQNNIHLLPKKTTDII